MLTQYAGQNLLLLASEDLIKNYREQKYGNLAHRSLNAGQVLKLPTYQLANELDRWILAELHQCLLSVDQGLKAYNLDGAIKTGIDFIEKLSNWYLRRSRRRFRENGMTADKHSAYATLYEVLKTYLQVMAPFTPFITEDLWLRLQMMNGSEQTSVHLSSWPFASEHYIDQDLMAEITMVRRAIKLALFIRSKNKIAVKQPLQSLQIKFE